MESHGSRYNSTPISKASPIKAANAEIDKRSSTRRRKWSPALGDKVQTTDGLVKGTVRWKGKPNYVSQFLVGIETDQKLPNNENDGVYKGKRHFTATRKGAAVFLPLARITSWKEEESPRVMAQQDVSQRNPVHNSWRKEENKQASPVLFSTTGKHVHWSPESLKETLDKCQVSTSEILESLRTAESEEYPKSKNTSYKPWTTGPAEPVGEDVPRGDMGSNNSPVGRIQETEEHLAKEAKRRINRLSSFESSKLEQRSSAIAKQCDLLLNRLNKMSSNATLSGSRRKNSPQDQHGSASNNAGNTYNIHTKRSTPVANGRRVQTPPSTVSSGSREQSPPQSITTQKHEPASLSSSPGTFKRAPDSECGNSKGLTWEEECPEASYSSRERRDQERGGEGTSSGRSTSASSLHGFHGKQSVPDEYELRKAQGKKAVIGSIHNIEEDWVSMEEVLELRRLATHRLEALNKVVEERDSLKEQLRSKDIELDKAKKEIHEDVSMLKRQLNSLKTELQDLREERNSLKAKNQAMSRALHLLQEKQATYSSPPNSTRNRERFETDRFTDYSYNQASPRSRTMNSFRQRANERDNYNVRTTTSPKGDLVRRIAALYSGAPQDRSPATNQDSPRRSLNRNHQDSNPNADHTSSPTVTNKAVGRRKNTEEDGIEYLNPQLVLRALDDYSSSGTE
eukprot:gb/GECG01007617.1/.p1 GENE.gb/GECG01007617.1/~~gb/GECG01007617.1/.p1  ORF type:complete len:683 (+),score=92.51 gb/GECG01007617.1/:1-2049(+)